MGVQTSVDAAVIGLLMVLGLLGIWMGFGRFLVWWPVRWLASLLGALIAAMLTMLYLVINRELLAPLYVSGTAGKSIAAAITFLVALLMLLTFMSNLRERIMVWSGNRRPGSVARVLGGFLGLACGLVLVGVPYVLYALTQPDRNTDPVWVRDSLSLAYLRSTGEAVKSALSSRLPTSPGRQPDR